MAHRIEGPLLPLVVLATACALSLFLLSCDQASPDRKISFPDEALIFVNSAKRGIVTTDLNGSRGSYHITDLSKFGSVRHASKVPQRNWLVGPAHRPGASSLYVLDLETGALSETGSFGATLPTSVAVAQEADAAFVAGVTSKAERPTTVPFAAKVSVESGEVLDTLLSRVPPSGNNAPKAYGVSPDGSWSAITVGRQEKRGDTLFAFSDHSLVILDHDAGSVAQEFDGFGLGLGLRRAVFTPGGEALFFTDRNSGKVYRVGRSNLDTTVVFIAPRFPGESSRPAPVELVASFRGSQIIAFHYAGEGATQLRLFDASGVEQSSFTLPFNTSGLAAMYSDSILCIAERHPQSPSDPPGDTWTGEDEEYTFHLVDIGTGEVVRSFTRTLPEELFYTAEMYIVRQQ